MNTNDIEVYRIGDIVLSGNDDTISLISETFTDAPPQINGSTYCNVLPIELSKRILLNLGFDVENIQQISSKQDYEYYSYSVLSQFNKKIGICYNKNIKKYIIGIYINYNIPNAFIEFIPFTIIEYIHQLQHILEDCFSFKLEKETFNEMKVLIKMAQDSDLNDKISELFE